MTLKTLANKVPLFRRVSHCFLCSKTQTNSCLTTSVEIEKTGVPNVDEIVLDKPKKVRGHSIKKHLRDVEKFFDENPNIAELKNFIPNRVLSTKTIAKHVTQRLQGENQVIAECNPGFGFITEALLQQGISFVKLYEYNNEFQDYLQEAFKDKSHEVKIYRKDLFTLARYTYVDNLDQGHRVEQMLEGLPRKSWTDDPVMTVVGTMTKISFMNYLVKSIILQRGLATYGRTDLFIITYHKFWKVFTATKDDSRRIYKPISILIQLLFEVELIDQYPRKFFLPWETMSARKRTIHDSLRMNPDHLYLIRLTMRKEFPLHADHFVPFYCFMLTLYGRGNGFIIPTCEKWIPDCGESLILPKLAHDDYFENIDIYTKFSELSPLQLISIYRELTIHPNYASSPFMDMVEQEWLKSETIETDIHDSHTKS